MWPLLLLLLPILLLPSFSSSHSFTPSSFNDQDVEPCNLNKNYQECWRHHDKEGWAFYYPKTKQEYVDIVSRGKWGLINPYREQGLVKRDGVKVGHVEKVKFDDDGRTVDVITKAMRPLMFEIPHFLTDAECEHIIKRAQDPDEGGMFESKAKGGLTPLDDFKPKGQRGQSTTHYGRFWSWDKNEDNMITVEEVIWFIHATKFIILLEKDVHDMFKTLDMRTDYFDKGYVNMLEFNEWDTLGMEEYVEIISRENPRFKHRSSNQAWLHMEAWADNITHIMRERVTKLTGLGREIVYGGERLQVVHYDPHGHYHAHMDTETHNGSDVTPCCHQQYEDMAKTVGKCKICRFITFLMYLNDVEEGGETAFPIADGPPMTEHYVNTELRGRDLNTDVINLMENCHMSNLVLKPKKGTAVLWYNHYVDPHTGWMGEIDPHSLHGGCGVKKGVKWICNMWIPAPYGHNTAPPSTYLNWRDYLEAETGFRF